jgi:hypothetical protein
MTDGATAEEVGSAESHVDLDLHDTVGIGC